MLPSKLIRTFTIGMTLVAPTAFAQSNAAGGEAVAKLQCPAGTKQFGNAKDGLFCRKIEAKDGVHVPHGSYASYHPNGKKSSEGQYVDGFRSGLWTFYDEAGQVTGRTEFEGGNYHGKRVQYFANGKPRIIEEFSKGKRNGVVQEFSEDGKLVRQARYQDDREVAAK